MPEEQRPIAKLVFTGEKVLEEIAIESGSLGITNEIIKAAVISEINKIFADGFRVPLEGLEFPVLSSQSDSLAHYTDCSRVDEPVLEGQMLRIGTDVEFLKTEGDYNKYSFGVRDFAERVLGYLKQTSAEAGRQDLYEAVFGKLSEREAMMRLVRFMMPESPRMSSTQFVLSNDGGDWYVADNGSIVGTWVDGAKLGYDYGMWTHWDKLDPRQYFDKGGIKSIFELKTNVTNSDGQTIFEVEPSFKAGRNPVLRAMNLGRCKIGLGSTIIVGYDNFRTEDTKPHYEFTLKEA